MARTLPIFGRTGALSTTPAVIALPEGWAALKLEVDTLSYAQLGNSYTAPAVGSTNGVTTISSHGTPTGGTFDIRLFPGQPIETLVEGLTYDESSADIETALVATGLFAGGDITNAGGALPTAITLTWTGVWAGLVPELVIEASLTGGMNPDIRAAVTTVPDSNGGYAYVAADTPEAWEAERGLVFPPRFLYVAAVTGTGNYWLSVYR